MEVSGTIQRKTPQISSVTSVYIDANIILLSKNPPGVPQAKIILKLILGRHPEGGAHILETLQFILHPCSRGILFYWSQRWREMLRLERVCASNHAAVPKPRLGMGMLKRPDEFWRLPHERLENDICFPFRQDYFPQ